MSIRLRKLWLAFPPFLWCMLDQSITLAGQSAWYWRGDYVNCAREGNPLFHWLLQQSPWAFEAGIAVWVLVFVMFVWLLPVRAALAVAVAVTMGHAWGAATWVSWYVANGYWVVLILFLLTGIVVSYICQIVYGNEQQPALASVTDKQSDEHKCGLVSPGSRLMEKENS